LSYLIFFRALEIKLDRIPLRKMHLMYYLDKDGNRVYTLKKKTPDDEKITESAHPARFSPDDKFSRHRIACKKRFGIYLPDSPMQSM